MGSVKEKKTLRLEGYVTSVMLRKEIQGVGNMGQVWTVVFHLDHFFYSLSWSRI